jgi:hypothetical protein
MARTINIDAKLAAKGEVTREPITVTFRGRDWNFAPSMPAALPEVAAEGKVMTALRMLLDPADRAAFDDLNVTIDEVGVLFEALGEIYGASVGESLASD